MPYRVTVGTNNIEYIKEADISKEDIIFREVVSFDSEGNNNLIWDDLIHNVRIKTQEEILESQKTKLKEELKRKRAEQKLKMGTATINGITVDLGQENIENLNALFAIYFFKQLFPENIRQTLPDIPLPFLWRSNLGESISLNSLEEIGVFYFQYLLLYISKGRILYEYFWQIEDAIKIAKSIDELEDVKTRIEKIGKEDNG